MPYLQKDINVLSSTRNSYYDKFITRKNKTVKYIEGSNWEYNGIVIIYYFNSMRLLKLYDSRNSQYLS